MSAPIVGATTMGHLDDAVPATETMPSDQEIVRLEAPYRPHPVLGHS